MKLIVDVPSVVKRCLYAGKDEENGRKVLHDGKQVQVNSAIYGYDNAVNSMVACMDTLRVSPCDVILVYEMGSTKARRKQMFAGYKAGSPSAPEIYESVTEATKLFLAAWRSVGALAVTQAHLEADDLIAFLCSKLSGKKVIFSEDGDLSQLINADTAMYRKGSVLESNPYGPFAIRHIRLMKSLVGDPSDGYKGAHGFGEKAWLDLLAGFDESDLDALEAMIRKKALHELAEDVGSFKPFQKIVDGATHVYESYDVAGLRPEWVDTLRCPLVWTAGMVRPNPDDYRLRKWGQQVRLVTAENYAAAYDFLHTRVPYSPVIALDIETSTPEASDQWLSDRGKGDKVDVFGSALTGFSLTFGDNGQYTYYVSVDHRDTANITVEQARQMVALIPQQKFTVVHNSAFELPVLWNTWGKDQIDNGWHGFLPNVIDTAIMSSYVDENRSAGLKSLSLEDLEYEQVNYETVTSARMLSSQWDGRGNITESYRAGLTGDESADLGLHDWVKVQYKMRELTAEHVLSYGADDTICTFAHYVHFRTRMEVEGTWNVMLEVEQYPAYVTALAFCQGTKFSLQRMLQLERDDQTAYAKAWSVVRAFLIDNGWEGTVTPTYETLTPAAVKEMTQIILGEELKTQVRTVSKLARLIAVMDHRDAPVLAGLIESEDLAGINRWVAERFTGEPIFEVGSPKQMKSFLYDTLKLPVRIVNSCTPLERQNKPQLATAVSRHKKIWAGSGSEPPLTEAEQELLKAKAKTDDTAVDFALAMDVPDNAVLRAFQTMKRCSTRETMFYNAYRHLQHWKDRKIHGQAGQCRTVTRRYAPSDPNLAQLPKKGEGVKFRECFEPHKKDAVIVSIDFSGQELRQGAGQSLDPNMLACFIGDHKKDMHSLTAAGAMVKKWGKSKIAELVERYGAIGDPYTTFMAIRNSKNKEQHPADYKLADDLRKTAKSVNFGAQYDAQAPKLAETLIIPVADAQTFLDAKFAMFPRFEEWKEEIKFELMQRGYVTTCMGARRHLRDAILSDNKWDMEKALRQGPNMKIQGSSAEQTKLAMARLWKSGILFNLDMVFFAPIHDELVWSVHRDDALESIRVVHRAMTQPYGGLPVPFLGSVSLGLNFGEQKECDDADGNYSEDGILKNLEKCFDGETVSG